MFQRSPPRRSSRWSMTASPALSKVPAPSTVMSTWRRPCPGSDRFTAMLYQPAITSALQPAINSAKATALRSMVTSSGRGASKASQAGGIRPQDQLNLSHRSQTTDNPDGGDQLADVTSGVLGAVKQQPDDCGRQLRAADFARI